MSTDNADKVRDEIILKTLPHVSFEGWTWEAVITGAGEAGHDNAALQALFPGQLLDVMQAFSDMADRAMLEKLKEQEQEPETMRIRDRIRAGVIARFEYLQPYKEAIRQSLIFWAVPFRKPAAAKMVWRTADHIWNWAGDESTDYNRYTKRGLLSGVIVSTTLAWINDSSEDMSVTKSFLDKRIENVMQLGRVIGKIKGAL